MFAFASSFAGASVTSPAPTASLSPRSAAPARRGVISMAGFWNDQLKAGSVKQWVPLDTTPKAPTEGAYGAPTIAPPFTGGSYAFAPAVNGFPKPNSLGASFDDVAPGLAGAKADQYMADTIMAQYRAIAGTNNGVYAPQCTEASYKGDAENARVLSLGASFRAGQRSLVAKYNSMYDNRAKAITLAHGCSAEEALVTKFPRSAYAMVKGTAETKATCIRYANPQSEVEAYLSRTIDLQMLRRAVPYGVYESCYDGSTSELVERSRVIGLAKNYTTKWASDNRKEQIKYDSFLHAEAMVGHPCNAEAALFMMPAVGQAMRPYSTHM